MSVAGSLTPGFSFAIAGSFHFVILPRKMSASSGPVNFSSGCHARECCRPARPRRARSGGAGSCPAPPAAARRSSGRRWRRRRRSAFGELTDAAARADRLVVDLDVRVQLVVLGEPLRVDRGRERRAGAVDLRSPQAPSGRRRREGRERRRALICTVFFIVSSSRLEIHERVDRDPALRRLCGREPVERRVVDVEQQRASTTLP